MSGKQLALAILALIAVGAVVAALVIIPPLLRDTAPEMESVQRPAAGEVRPDYLADGTPVWVMGHQDGSASVLSGFDTHLPYNIGKILWWCPTAGALENPNHGSKYDEYGRKIGGPAPTGLPPYRIRETGSRIYVGDLLDAPAPDAGHIGPAEVDRDWCTFPEDDVIYHTFEGWQAWDSPSAAVEAAPDGWILLDAALWVRDGEVVLCSLGGCQDAVRATNVDPSAASMDPNDPFGPLNGERFIARVVDGALTGVTRVMPASQP